MPPRLDRRRFLSLGVATTAGLSAGCLGTDGTSDFSLKNRTEESVEATLSVSEKDGGQEVFTATRTVPSGKPSEHTVSLVDPIESGGDYIVVVELANGRSAGHEWEAWDSDRNGLNSFIYDDRIEFRVTSSNGAYQ